MEQNENINKAKAEENIELHSENTRRFIGDVPPTLVRVGTVIVSLIVVLFAMAVLFLKYGNEYLFAILFYH